MEYIKPIFLLLFVLGIVAAVSSRHAAKHYPLEDAGNQDESSLVKETLKRQDSFLTSAFDIGEEKHERKVISDSNVKDIVGNLVVKIHNQLDKDLVKGKAYLLKGKDVEPGFSPKVAPGIETDYKVQEIDAGAAGVFTYEIPDQQATLAVMFSHHADDGKFKVEAYPASQKKSAEPDLYCGMNDDNPQTADGKRREIELGFGLNAFVLMTTKNPPTLEIDIGTVAE